MLPFIDNQNLDDALQKLTSTSNIRDKLSPVLENLEQRFFDGLALLPVFLISLIFMWIAVKFSKQLTKKHFISKKITKNPFLQDILSQSIRCLIIIGALVICLEMLGASSLIGAVLGAAGVLGLAISFAFRDIIENYIAGILLSLKTPFMPGDHVSFAGVNGLVIRMTTRATILKTFDGNNITIPNATVFKEKIENFSVISERRFQFGIGVDCDCDPDIARRVGLKALKQLRGVKSDPAPFALTDGLGASSIDLSFYGWVDQDHDDMSQVRSAAIRAVKYAIEGASIKIPSPSYNLVMQQVDPEEIIESCPVDDSAYPDHDEDYDLEFGNNEKLVAGKLIVKESIKKQEDLLVKADKDNLE